MLRPRRNQRIEASLEVLHFGMATSGTAYRPELRAPYWNSKKGEYEYDWICCPEIVTFCRPVRLLLCGMFLLLAYVTFLSAIGARRYTLDGVPMQMKRAL